MIKKAIKEGIKIKTAINQFNKAIAIQRTHPTLTTQLSSFLIICKKLLLDQTISTCT